MKKRLFFILLSVFLMAAIFYFSDMPANQSNAVSEPVAEAAGLSNSEMRKIAHFLCFSFLSVSFWGLFSTFQKLRFPKVYAFIATVLYAVTDEVHQIFVPGRACEWEDLVTDSAGALVVLLLFSFFALLFRRKKT